MYKNKYQIENAIIDGARAAYLATSIEKVNEYLYSNTAIS